jgi:CheY-like chemotaxis protein
VTHEEGPILVVEDDSGMRDALVTVLEGEGWSTLTVTNGAEAVGQLEKGLRPRLVVVDLMLPRVSGWDLLQYLRETVELSKTPTLVITGFPRENLRVSADVVLHKPVDYDRLIAAVRKLITPGSVRNQRPAV